MNLANPALSIRVADECFEDYILNSEFTFTVSGFAQARIGESVESWQVEPVEPYRSPIIVMLRPARSWWPGWTDVRSGTSS